MYTYIYIYIYISLVDTISHKACVSRCAAYPPPVLYYTILYYTILYCTILHYAILYYTMLCYAMLCHAMLYYDITYYIIPRREPGKPARQMLCATPCSLYIKGFPCILNDVLLLYINICRYTSKHILLTGLLVCT